MKKILAFGAFALIGCTPGMVEEDVPCDHQGPVPNLSEPIDLQNIVVDGIWINGEIDGHTFTEVEVDRVRFQDQNSFLLTALMDRHTFVFSGLFPFLLDYELVFCNFYSSSLTQEHLLDGQVSKYGPEERVTVRSIMTEYMTVVTNDNSRYFTVTHYYGVRGWMNFQFHYHVK